MSSQKETLLSRVQLSYRQLATASATLNTASDNLSQSIAELDAALNELNLGISTWVIVSSGDDGPYYWKEEIGYAKIGGKWGIGIRTVSGSEIADDEDEVVEWLFNDAARSLRIKAAERIPDLLDALAKEAIETAKNVQKRADEVRQFSVAITTVAGQAANEPSGRR